MAEFEGIFIEITPTSEESMEFRCGYQFPEGTDPDMIDYFKTIVAGFYGIFSSHPEDLITVGEIVRTVSDFDVPQSYDEEGVVSFEPDPDLLSQMGEEKVIDLAKYNPDPKKKKH